MVKFAKPGKSERPLQRDGVQGAKARAARRRRRRLGDVSRPTRATCYGDSTCGQRAVYEVGLTGIPVFNVNNNCSTGSSALMLGRQAIEGGVAECVLVVGFEQMEKGALGSKWTDRTNPMDKHAGRDERACRASTRRHRGADVRRRRSRVSVEARHQARDLRQDQRRRRASTPAKNPYALFRVLSVEEILASPEVFDPLTRYQCCPPTCGAAAAIAVLRRLRQEEQHRQSGLHCRPNHDHRLPVELRALESMIKMSATTWP